MTEGRTDKQVGNNPPQSQTNLHTMPTHTCTHSSTHTQAQAFTHTLFPRLGGDSPILYENVQPL